VTAPQKRHKRLSDNVFTHGRQRKVGRKKDKNKEKKGSVGWGKKKEVGENGLDK